MKRNFGLKHWLTQNILILNKQLVKEEQIKIETMPRLFKVFNIDKTKNREVTQFVQLELEIDGYI